jgi:hypothetical protein
LIGVIAAVMMARLFRNFFMSKADVKKYMNTPEMLEMRDWMSERTYEGRIYAPVGC